MKLSKKIISVAAGSLALLGSVGAQAATANTTFQVTATVVNSCVVSATELAFGSITPTQEATALAKTSEISVTCSNAAPYTVSVGFGANAGTAEMRYMKNSVNEDKLAYNIFTEAAHTNVFGDGTAESKTVGLTGTGTAQKITVYGKLLQNQFVSSGTYADTLSVNVAY